MGSVFFFIVDICWLGAVEEILGRFYGVRLGRFSRFGRCILELQKLGVGEETWDVEPFCGAQGKPLSENLESFLPDTFYVIFHGWVGQIGDLGNLFGAESVIVFLFDIVQPFFSVILIFLFVSVVWLFDKISRRPHVFVVRDVRGEFEPVLIDFLSVLNLNERVVWLSALAGNVDGSETVPAVYNPRVAGHTRRTERDNHFRFVLYDPFCHPVEVFVLLMALEVPLREIAGEALKGLVVIDPERFARRVSCDELDFVAHCFVNNFFFSSLRTVR